MCVHELTFIICVQLHFVQVCCRKHSDGTEINWGDEVAESQSHEREIKNERANKAGGAPEC